MKGTQPTPWGMAAGWDAPGVNRRALAALSILAALAILPYLPALSQPFIADDYVQIHLGRKYGPAGNWGDLWRDPLYHARATSIVATYWTERLFGLSPPVVYASSIAVHVLNTWMLFLLGAWRRIGWRLAAVMAGFFAIYIGHQEAVMWYAALPELLVFFFILAFAQLWLRWAGTGSVGWYLASLVCFGLALLSKESAVVLVPLAVLAVLLEGGGKTRLVSTLPLLVAAVAYMLNIFAAKSQHLHFNDGTFSLSAPFWVVWTRSIGRMLFIWGLISLGALAALRRWKEWRDPLILGSVWMSVTILPYCFLTYMPHVPSRHTYLPSAGLALLVAAGLLTLQQHLGVWRRWAPAAMLGVLLIHQCGYIWWRKHPQFLERARPTEKLIEMARTGPAAIRIHCFPYGEEIARLSLEITLAARAPKLEWADHPPARGHESFWAE